MHKRNSTHVLVVVLLLLSGTFVWCHIFTCNAPQQATASSGASHRQSLEPSRLEPSCISASDKSLCHNVAYHAPVSRTPAQRKGDASECYKTHPKPDSDKADINIFRELFEQLVEVDRRLIILEMGAFNGWSFSYSWIAEYCHGWEAVLVEANPPMFDQIVEARPNAHTLRLSPSCKHDNQEVSFVAMPYTGAYVGDNPPHKRWKASVHCGPLEPYLRDMGLNHIDMWIELDVEGAASWMS